jgi:molecular chaperone DnaK
MSNKVFGIDLGTGNSCVAVIEGGKPVVIANAEGNRTTPSVVFIKGDERKIGSTAKRGMIMNPKNTVSFIKRFMGAEWNDPDVQKMLTMITYEVVNKNNKPYVRIDGKDYSAEEISSYILADLAKVASDYYGEDVKDCVITVPAWFNDVQRKATKLAGELAGLTVHRIINEPTAAILAAGMDKEDKERLVLVNDLGCGTEDVSICEVSQGMVEVLASDGDVFLGGQNYDNEIVDWMAEEFMKDHSGVDLRKDPMAYARLIEAAEKAKCELSTSKQTEINLPYITVQDGVPQMLVMTLTRAKFESLTKKYTDKVIEIAKRALQKANKTASDITDILLVGGSSRMPQVQEALKNTFGDKLNKQSNFDEAVALGAVIQAKAIVNPEESDTLLLDVTPISLGIEVNGNMFGKLIDANTTIPCKKSQVFTTAVDNQPAVTIVVLQGERPMSKDNKQIGIFNLDGIAPAPRGIPQIEVTFDIDANGTLTVSAKDLGTQKEQHITISDSNALSQEEIDRIKKEAEEHKAEDDKKKAEMDKKNAAEGYIYSVEKSLTDDNLKDKFTDDEKKQLEDLVKEAKEAIDSKDDAKMFEKKDELEKVYNPIITRIYQENMPKDQNGNPQVDPNMFSQMFNGGQGGDAGNPFSGNPFQAGAPFESK